MTKEFSSQQESCLENIDIEKDLKSSTPMMRQYIEIKSINPDSLLFYRMGDFYELFFEDAIIASRCLGITLTKRGKHLGKDVPMCGIPVHTSNHYIQKLIKIGHRIALCEQIETPLEAKKRDKKSLVRRNVVRLVTPGTITEDQLLSPTDSNYLMAVARIRTEWAIAWIDISTGVFKISKSNRNRLISDIMRIDPREVIFSEEELLNSEYKSLFETLGNISIPQPCVFFDNAVAENRIVDYYGITTMDTFGSFSQSEKTAAAAAISYIKKTQLVDKPTIGYPEREDIKSILFIDSAARSNLEILHTLSGSREGSLLKNIDYTLTGGGGRLFAERIASPLTNPQKINIRLDSINFFLKNPELVKSIQTILKSSPDIPRALSRLKIERGEPRDIAVVRNGIRSGIDMLDAISKKEIPEELRDAVKKLQKLPQSLEKTLSAMLSDDLPTLKRDGGFLRDGADPSLDEARLLRDQSKRIIASLQLKYAEETNIKNIKIKHNNHLGYFIEVTSSNAKSLTKDFESKDRFIHRQTMANLTRFTTLELIDLENRITNATNRALSIELEAFETLSKAIIEHSESLNDASKVIDVIDVSIALTTLAREQNYCRPIVDDSTKFIVKDGRHPVVEKTLKYQSSKPFITNDCDLSCSDDKKNGKLWLLTGPNMGGKSTFLRQNALIVIMAQMGSYVPASSVHIGIVDKLFSRVGSADNLASGRSTFMVEMIETASILNQATNQSFVILDEIGRGTSTLDGLSIAWATIEYLHEINLCRGLLATHFHELTDLSKSLARFHNATLQVSESAEGIVFLHKVIPGIADHSYGIQVGKLAGLPPSVISRAYEVLKTFAKLYDKNQKDVREYGQISKLPPEESKDSISKKDLFLEKINQLDPNEMTPLKALETLYTLKAWALEISSDNTLK
ncbi:DNA mismatch repair protein MutS [Candidatus Liberibacter solanacearum]|uniref:DNA mismatch repair protein MutS n=2 Tax=Candidatus Liberibacter solanacearum TaxID=556287 RepID=A0A094Z4U9_9HYPH|nr:DNA mismatch repair protein MutS [Candidatus Liberibacter solanacearum]KGB27994.1 DNA mismatch repair protein MutS [Candidatus Liberibacter solanacearum]KJZ82085.1 DNA mismatch repair protein MutS [Candidatus Liberibacter solanacearum]KQC49498.1 DNA mismatch repair protein MutS [Candidatus Liberibacter solanacearum]